ncbi:hypothetical protein GCM10010261_56950 [Streptomyces pilosus]|uniref:Uncharacterized protein n=1 Tax=Streptomyces pilosus TaxID=28893 RepID=A0A918BWB4_9ACTN|nr:hypothetical protein GCM10010280_49480 [Streptomyces pilosus]GGV65527.1 hypothetical protein GCM10010261_56950 [Streptomyces pilosus]
MFLTGTRGFRGSDRRYGRAARPDKEEPLRAAERFVASGAGPAANRCTPPDPRARAPGGRRQDRGTAAALLLVSSSAAVAR